MSKCEKVVPVPAETLLLRAHALGSARGLSWPDSSGAKSLSWRFLREADSVLPDVLAKKPRNASKSRLYILNSMQLTT